MKPLKPDYDSNVVQADLVHAVCSFYGRVFDDFEVERHLALRGHRPGDEKWLELMTNDEGEVMPTINETAEHFDITPAKVRKLLITGGMFDTDFFRKVKRLHGEGRTVNEISILLKKKPVTIRSYLPYERVIYKLDERSVNADRLVRFKRRWGGYKANPDRQQREQYSREDSEKPEKKERI